MLFGTNHTLNNFGDILLKYGNNIIERVMKFSIWELYLTYFWPGVNMSIIFLLSPQAELVLFADLNFVYLHPLYIYLLMLCSFHILIIVVQFGLTAPLNSVILFKSFKTNLPVFFCLPTFIHQLWI